MLKFYTSQLRKCQSMCTICSRVPSTFGTFIQCSEVLPSNAKTVHLYGMTTTKRALCYCPQVSHIHSLFRAGIAVLDIYCENIITLTCQRTKSH